MWSFLLIFCFSLPLSFLLTSWLRELACQLHGGLFNPTRQLQNANPSTKTLRTAPLPRIYSPQKCMKSQHKGIERHITCCKTFNHVQAHQPYNYNCCQGCISCGTCSYPELTEDHVLTSAYVKIFRIVTRNAVNKSF